MKELLFTFQDVLNLLFHFRPDLLGKLGTEFNFRPDQCLTLGHNKDQERVVVVHGNRGCFHESSYYSSIKNYYNLARWVLKNAYILLYVYKILPVALGPVSAHRELFRYVDNRDISQIDRTLLQKLSQAQYLCQDDMSLS